MMKKLVVDSELLDEAQMIGHISTEEETIKRALKEFIQRRKQGRIVEMFGTIDFDPDYDYKVQREVD
jgi:hypothetical protein